jgi:hemerythrin superfamily protein
MKNDVGTTAARHPIMRDETDALELLRSQHDDVEDLIEKIENSDDASEKQALFVEMADKLAAHATIEEKIFYPAVLDDKTRDMLVESTEEHLSVKRILSDMLALDVEDEHFDAKLSVLKEQIGHHAHDEEEDILFPKVRRMMSADELVGLGDEMLAMFESLLERAPRNHVPSETREAAPLPSA